MEPTHSSPFPTKRSLNSKFLPYLTRAIHIPTPLLSTFLLIHLSAPILSNVGGSSYSSSVMLLGREYYQGSPNETLLVFGPLALHLSASLLKRILSPSPLTPPKSLLSKAGLASVLLLPVHILIHRFYPSDPSPPISSLGPGQLDYSFVQYALQNWPIRSTILYMALTSATIMHAIEGSSLLWKRYFTNPRSHSEENVQKGRNRRFIGIAGILATLSGLFTLWMEPIAMPLPSLLTRFDAILRNSLLFRSEI
ncbi:hypothetical protein PNOK_0432400 [Pyrrhoderma noxium]|uniref:Mitochondrial adapter protein MCP1 transmembrane domain-containing protein n=1 Tax=Pyrrhoderma noxium TaxID=2282107 RepID=A0A286UID8_9AGAM|nr:hypothetical protein PNOK_0432400 [Pyrrhoderma noxium]